VTIGVFVHQENMKGGSPEISTTTGSRDQKKKMETQAVTNGRDEITKLQEALKAKGEDPGSIDGFMGKKTRRALKAFQKANGLKASGRLDDQTAEKLGIQQPGHTPTKEMKEENN
jgi:peptidoglycan hydrolase-like protein with peptidoglycan-binding domain